MSIRNIILCLPLVALLGCATGHGTPMRCLARGMTKDQVDRESHLRNSSYTVVNGPSSETWVYRVTGGGQIFAVVHFDSLDRVTDYRILGEPCR